MKQIIQDLKNGETILEEVPVPQVKAGYVLIKTSRSLVSLGTERMLVEFGKANLIDKARQQPDKVKQVLDKIKTDGIQPTLEAVFNKLGQPLPLGYCNVGTVIALGRGVTEFNVGDRVASNGNHAEYVSVPKNLVALIPDTVSKSRKTKCDGREKRNVIFEAKTKCAQKSRLLPLSSQNTSVVQTPFESCLNDAFLLNFLLKYHLKPIANLAKNRIFT